MPLHDFQCPACGCRFEELVKGDEVPGCPKCGREGARRLPSFSAQVSTAASRERAAAGARRRAKGIKREQDHAHAEYMRKHMADHE